MHRPRAKRLSGSGCPEEFASLLRQAEVLHGQGMTMADAIWHLGASEVTSYLHGRLS